MLRKIPSWLIDLGVAFVVGAFSLANAFHRGDEVWLLAPLSLLGALLLFRRRRYPVAVLAAETVLATILGLFGAFWLVAGVIAGVWTVAGQLDRSRSLRLSIAAAAIVALPALGGNGWRAWHLVPQGIFFVAAWLYGENKRAYDLEREERSLKAVAEERTRIARELHDVVTHNVSVMVVQAAAGNDVWDSHPERAREALRNVEDTGRRALGELRRLLDITADGEGTLPQPGLDRVDELVEQVRRAGLAVGVTVEGTRRPVPEALDLSAYRIVQEALTNTLRHAHATHAAVRVRYSPEAIEVEVADDGVGPNGGAGHGRGLIGMRERVGLFGGDLHTGAGPDGGFAVRARIPLGAA